VPEGDVGQAELVFKVTLSEPSSEVVKVAYETVDGTAKADGFVTAGNHDYEAKSATLRFDPGETEQRVVIDVNGDGIGEKDETVHVRLSKPAGATIAKADGLGTIQNDDTLTMPWLSIEGRTVSEGDSGGMNVALTVALSEASKLPIVVD
jgi:hypothetical protein